MDKVVEKEIAKQMKEQENLGVDITGFLLFNNETDQSHTDQPEVKGIPIELDIENHSADEDIADEVAYEEFTLESKVPVGDELEFHDLSFDEEPEVNAE